jgi:Acetoacetate decarboxylase (ADC)
VNAVAVLGQSVDIPVEVRSAKMVGGTFTAPYTAAHEIIAYSGLRPLKLVGTLALCVVSAVQYTDSDLGPYNEVALAIAVDAPSGGGGGLTTFIHRLPVNQEFTCAAGRDIWGFPKWVADISFQERPGRTVALMMDGGELAMALSVDTRFAVPVPSSEVEMTCYSYREGTLRRTPWTMRMSQVKMRPGGVSVDVGERNQLADDLRALGFPKKGLLAQTVGHLSCTFGAAEIVRP